MKIDVYQYPSCTWVKDGDGFFCTHDEKEVVDYESPYMDMNGNVSYYKNEGYVCADVDCGEALDGSPEVDRAEAMDE